MKIKTHIMFKGPCNEDMWVEGDLIVSNMNPYALMCGAMTEEGQVVFVPLDRTITVSIENPPEGFLCDWDEILESIKRQKKPDDGFGV